MVWGLRVIYWLEAKTISRDNREKGFEIRDTQRAREWGGGDKTKRSEHIHCEHNEGRWDKAGNEEKKWRVGGQKKLVINMRLCIPQFERSSIWKSLKVEGRREAVGGGGWRASAKYLGHTECQQYIVDWNVFENEKSCKQEKEFSELLKQQ